MKLTFRVLVMDDDVDLRRYLRDALEREGLDVRIAVSVPQLINLARQDHFDAGIVDIQLSEGRREGLEAIDKLRTLRPNIYLEVLSRYRQFKPQAMKIGADLFVDKPKGDKEIKAKEAAQRIKLGILEKKLEALKVLAKRAGITLPQFDLHQLNGDDYHTAWTALSTDISIDVLDDIHTFLESDGEKKYGLTKAKNKKLMQDLADIILKIVIPRNGTAQKNNRKNGHKHDLVSNSSENYSVFIENRASFEKNYMGQYIAIVNRKFAGAHYDLRELYKLLSVKFEPEAANRAFIKKLKRKREGREIHLDLEKPRRIIRD